MDRFTKLVAGGLKTRASATHPDANLLAAFAENCLQAGEREQVLRHVSECADCRDVLYMAAPEAQDAQQFVLRQPSGLRFALRWGAALASLIVFAFVFTTRYSMRKAASPAAPQVALEKAPAEFYTLQDRDERTRDKFPETTHEIAPPPKKQRPPTKPMTGKPAMKFEFDKSGEVHVAASAPLPARDQVADSKDLSVGQNQVAIDANTAAGAANAKAVPAAQPPVPSASEAVEVPAGTVPLITNGSIGEEAELKKQKVKQDSTRSYGYAGFISQLPRWTLSPQGVVQRSLDSGKTWQPVPVAQNVVFRAISATGSEIWAGGNGGALFHSKDSGGTWSRIEPAAAGQKLQADITRIDFTDPRNGTVSAANGEIWATADGGATWFRK
jgi:hypothetical protein